MKKIIFLSILLAGCATIDPTPVTTYSEAIVITHSGFKKVFDLNYGIVKSAYANEYVKNPNNKFYNLVLTSDGGFYDFRANSGSILRTIKKEKQLLESLNITMISYCRILQRLANCDNDALVNAQELRQATIDMLDSQKELRINAKYDVFSGAFLAAADLYLENKRIDVFRDAVTNNQENIQNYSDICITLLHMMRDDIFRYYASFAEPAREQFDSQDKILKTGGVLQMIELNDRVESCLAMMKEMEEVYKVLPRAHLEMAEATKLPPIIETIWGPKKNDLSNIEKLNYHKTTIKLSLQ